MQAAIEPGVIVGLDFPDDSVHCDTPTILYVPHIKYPKPIYRPRRNAAADNLR